jgi:eukaryotic-like serine/threonine-protein kinase
MGYRRVRQINRRGFGIVYEIEDDNGRHFAMKVFDPQTTDSDEREKLRKRFAREVRIQSQIRHPNIMPIIEFDLDVDPPWFTMPLACQSFDQKIIADHPSGIVDTAAWQDILAAVEELHRLGYVHRDLKPGNVLLVDNRWVLADFGLILPMARDTTILTSSRSAYGSHYYAAPEQASDFRNTPEQSDIFALGCILHDSIETDPVRVAFSQIRVGGIYGPILEKCTESEPRKRFTTVAALRSILFDLWRTTQFEAPISADADLLQGVLNSPNLIEAWRGLIGHTEAIQAHQRATILRSINAELLVQLNSVDDVLFSRLMSLICEWASGTAFDWDYCDVVGDRLIEAYRMASVRVRCQIVLAALELAVSHNRWHVMNQVGAMLGQAADNGLVDRMLIELDLDSSIEASLRRIEDIVHWARDRWHVKIKAHLDKHDNIEEPSGE